MPDRGVKYIPRAEYEARVGQEIGLSDWITVTQERINQFAACTGDHQYIHTDPERSRHGPFGKTIAHGFLTLSMIAEMMQKLPRIEGVKVNVNYGLDRVRFISPVPVDSRVRGRFTLSRVAEVKPAVIETVFAVQVEIEGNEKPALVTDWRARRYL
ncbi:MaoC family dehydratase [uncultured Roseibium sp.]|uniref:MaoC family dehydratase n=1 Tax=uncultured Roseibium sp. TaxID=1936171 RepID=UPI00321797CE